jgi:hypothetical protein
MAPVRCEVRAAVEVDRAADRSVDGVATGTCIAGIAEAPGATRRGASDGGQHAPGRVVLHVDIDAFFAAIEQQRDPRLGASR